MKHLLAMLGAVVGVLVVTGIALKLLVHSHPFGAVIVFFGGFFLLRRAFASYLKV